MALIWLFVTCPLTLSHPTLLRLLDAEEPRVFPGESETNISDAVAYALVRLKSAGPRRKVLVLLTDGGSNVGPDPVAMAQTIAAQGVAVFAAGVGAPISPAGHTVLQTLAAQTGGKYYHPNEVSRLGEDISYSDAGITVRETKDLWDMPIVFFLVLLLCYTEWVLRRRWGVV